ncbi:uncharacterized protein [Typha angustifolia]|uniref:uncharacterized protein isoform X1 n=1 Tax=Typha angustifolia TaxID=59011 RepID=UPI003C2F2CB9
MHSAHQADQINEQCLDTEWNSLVSVGRKLNFDWQTGFPSYGVGVEQRQEFYRSTDGTLSPSNYKLSMDKDLDERKRKAICVSGARQTHLLQSRMQKAADEQQKVVSPEPMKNLVEKDDKKQKSELDKSASGIAQKSPTAKQVKQHHTGGDAPKEDCIHVRAKRGHATNSHSLAERVRREKISERMRLLQELVPGCNKITGKAVMLDEIINYVQSLQRQVEFLSMKLAAVSSELNVDLEQILSKDIILSRVVPPAILRSEPETSNIHAQLYRSLPPGIVQPEMLCSISNPQDMLQAHISAVTPTPGMWDSELQNLMHMSLIPQSCIENAGIDQSFGIT